MKARTSLTPFLIGLFSLSIMITGCSRQLYTSLVSSDDALSRDFASRSIAPFTSERLTSQLSQSIGDNLSQAGMSDQIVASDIPVELPPRPRLGGSDSDSLYSGQMQGKAGFQQITDGRTSKGSSNEGNGGRGQEFHTALQPGAERNGGLSSLDESRFGSQVGETTTSRPSSSFSDGITPLNDNDLLTEMAAASGTSSGTGADSFSSRQKGTGLTSLGNELLGKGNIGDVFFDFDAAIIRSDAEPILQANAQILKASFENREIIIEGHCDERGTAEYNLVLGERRAQSTKQYLVDLGVSATDIQTVSYGKEKPFCTASQPDCWKMNRRGHFALQ